MQNPTTSQTQFVYVIHAIGTNRIKLGFSRKPKERLAGLQTAAPYPLQMLACWPGSRSHENRLHRYMLQFRKVGEWFEVPPFIGLKLYELITKGEPTAKLKVKHKAAKGDDSLWRMERNGKYYFFRHRFNRETKPGGKITPEIEEAMKARKGHGRHKSSREDAERLSKPRAV